MVISYWNVCIVTKELDSKSQSHSKSQSLQESQIGILSHTSLLALSMQIFLVSWQCVLIFPFCLYILISFCLRWTYAHQDPHSHTSLSDNNTISSRSHSLPHISQSLFIELHAYLYCNTHIMFILCSTNYMQPFLVLRDSGADRVWAQALGLYFLGSSTQDLVISNFFVYINTAHQRNI